MGQNLVHVVFEWPPICDIETRVSNGTGQCNFSGQRDRSSFVVPGQRDNGTTGQAKNLAKGLAGLGRAGIAKIQDGTRDKTGQSRKRCSKTGK